MARYGVEERLVWLNGETVPVRDARINVLAPTSQFGLNVFEEFRAFGVTSDRSCMLSGLRIITKGLFGLHICSKLSALIVPKK